MPAVVRVKRRIDEEPLSAFLLNGKKRRIEDGGSEGDGAGAGAVNKEVQYENKINTSKEEISTVLKFAGTINKQDDTTQIIRLTKDAAKEIVQQRGKTRVTNHTERIRNELRDSVRDQRFRVVNCMRTTLDATASNEITIVDIEEDKSATTTTTTLKKNVTKDDTVRPSDSDTGYVYDLYLPENEQLVDDVDLMDDYLSIRAVNEWGFEDCYQEEDTDDSEDSNQENYYTNDYPDENSNVSSSEDDIREMADAIERFVMDDEDDDEERENSDENFAECSSEDEEEHHFDCQPYPRSYRNGEFVDDVDDFDEEEDSITFHLGVPSQPYPRFLRNAVYDNISRNSNYNEHAVEEAFHSASENGEDDNDEEETK